MIFEFVNVVADKFHLFLELTGVDEDRKYIPANNIDLSNLANMIKYFKLEDKDKYGIGNILE